MFGAGTGRCGRGGEGEGEGGSRRIVVRERNGMDTLSSYQGCFQVMLFWR